MLLCDVGNTNVKFNHNGKVWSSSLEEFQCFKPKQKVFYISVNVSLSKYLATHSDFIDLEPYYNFDTIYKNIGIDRVSACYTIKNGLVIDAGTAITIDIISNKIHLGGFILPGIYHYLNAYKSISPRLNIPINSNIDLNALPQSTANAVSYGIIKSIVLLIQTNCKDKKIYLTGGDGAFFSRFFPQSIYKQNLVFDGMIEVIKQNNLS